jgi:hypothetical protein
MQVTVSDSKVPEEPWEDGWILYIDDSGTNTRAGLYLLSPYNREEKFMSGLGYKYKIGGSSPLLYTKEIAKTINLVTIDSIIGAGRVG